MLTFSCRRWRGGAVDTQQLFVIKQLFFIFQHSFKELPAITHLGKGNYQPISFIQPILHNEHFQFGANNHFHLTTFCFYSSTLSTTAASCDRPTVQDQPQIHLHVAAAQSVDDHTPHLPLMLP